MHLIAKAAIDKTDLPLRERRQADHHRRAPPVVHTGCAAWGSPA
jgi:hypothetical protein